MEDRDPAVALQACMAAIRRGGLGGESSVDELERCLRRVGDALREKEREIEWLREALEQSRENYEEERSRAQLAQSSVTYGDWTSGSGSCTLSSDVARHTGNEVEGSGGVVSLSSDHVTNTDGLEPSRDGMTEPVYENSAVPNTGNEIRTKDQLRTLQSRSDGRFSRQLICSVVV